MLTSTSCEDPDNPCYHPMTKWETDNLELYVLEVGKGLLIFNYEDEKFAYDVRFFAGSSMAVYDRRETFFTDKETTDFIADERTDRAILYPIGVFSLHSCRETSCKVSCGEVNIFFQSGVVSEEIRFDKTADGLTLDDIPQIDLDEDYGYCPIYYPESKWISDDSRIVITMTKATEDEKDVGIVEFVNESKDDVYICFFECNSKAYLGELKENADSLFGDVEYYDIRKAQDEWRCEYFENSFKATVIRSDYYEVGSVINFTRLEDDVVTE